MIDTKEIKIRATLVDVIDGVVNYIQKEYKTHKWVDDNTLTFSASRKKCVVKFPEFSDDGEAENQEVILTIIPDIEKPLNDLIAQLKLDINAEEIENSIFEGTDNIYKYDYIKLGKNVKVFRELNKFFSRYGIERFGIQNSITSDIHNFCSEKMAMIVTPYNSRGQPTPLSDDFFGNYTSLEGYKRPSIGGEEIEIVADEKLEDIKIGNYKIGKYYKDRNLILIWFNPFTGIDMTKYTSYTDNKWLAKILPEIMKRIVELKIKKVDVSDFSIRLLVDSFKKEQTRLTRDTKKKLEKVESQIEQYGAQLATFYEQRVAHIGSIEALGTLDRTQIENEVKLLQQNPLLDKVELKEGAIFVTFIETSLKCPMNRSVDGSSETFGIRDMYLGKVGFKLTGGNNITVFSDSPKDGEKNPHPHADVQGKPCFGSGDGRNSIFKLLGERKLNDLTSMLWMWIHTFRSNDAYVHVNDWYDDRLKQGYPVFDHKGEPVKINDKERIESGEQRKMQKNKNWEENQKKTKDFKPQQ